MPDTSIEQADKLEQEADDLEREMREAFAGFESILWNMSQAAQNRATAKALRALAEVEPEADAARFALDSARADLKHLTTRADRVGNEIRDAQRRVDEALEREREAVLALDIDTAGAAKSVARELRGAVRVFVAERDELKAKIATARDRLAAAELVAATADAKLTATRDALDTTTPSEDEATAPWLIRGLIDPEAHPAGALVVRVMRTRLALLGPVALMAWGAAYLGEQKADEVANLLNDPLYLRHNNGFGGATAPVAPKGGRPVGGFVPRDVAQHMK